MWGQLRCGGGSQGAHLRTIAGRRVQRWEDTSRGVQFCTPAGRCVQTCVLLRYCTPWQGAGHTRAVSCTYQGGLNRTLFHVEQSVPRAPAAIDSRRQSQPLQIAQSLTNQPVAQGAARPGTRYKPGRQPRATNRHPYRQGARGRPPADMTPARTYAQAPGAPAAWNIFLAGDTFPLAIGQLFRRQWRRPPVYLGNDAEPRRQGSNDQEQQT